MAQQYKIFYGILDWGLGHASRSIPIIRHLLSKDFELHIGSAGRSLDLLQHEIQIKDKVQFFQIPAYAPVYKGENALLSDMLLQAPRFLKTIDQEEIWLKQQHEKADYDFIISDSRFGLHNASCKNIFISHQATILTPGKLGLLQFFTNQWYQYKYLKHFDELWIPDAQGALSISGKLAHTDFKIKKRFIGPISRFSQSEKESKNYSYDLLLLLSGPEPQRSFLEEKLIREIKKTNLRTLCIQGKTEIKTQRQDANIEYISYLSGDALCKAILAAENIICRSGYSTIMDLIALNRNAILIPTPGQTEQEYLAKYLKEKKWFYSFTQKEFKLEKALSAAKKYNLDTAIPVNYFAKEIDLVFK